MTEEQNIDLRHAKARAWYAKKKQFWKGSDKLGFIQCGARYVDHL
jgi:hypothetical protein